MNTKTQELVTAGYALAKGLDAGSAKLVKELADELAVQRVRADELNKQVVNLAVENAGLKSAIEFATAPDMWVEDADGMYDYKYCEWYVDVLNEAMATNSTDAAIANIQAQGVEKFAANEREWAAHWEKHGVTDGSVSRCLMVAQDSEKFAAQLRKEAGNAN